MLGLVLGLGVGVRVRLVLGKCYRVRVRLG